MKNFFKGISFSSISAGALAAVTSFLLSAKIGIAGSVIGVAAGSIVSAVSTQVYKNVLKASGEKLQSAVPFVSNDKDEKGDGDKTTVLEPAEQLTEDEGERTEVMPASDDASPTGMPAAPGRVISSAQVDGDETSVLPGQGAFRPKASSQGQIQHAGRRSLNAWLHSKHAPIVIAFVSALVGVGVSAGLILAFTGGHGTDTVVRDVVHEKVVPSHDDDSDSGYDDGTGMTQNNTQDSESNTVGGNISGKDTGKKTNNSSNGSGDTSSGGSGSSSTNSGTSTGKTDSSTDTGSPSNGSTSNGTDAGQTDGGSSASQNGSNSSSTDSTSNGTQNDDGTSGVSGTAGSGTGTAN
mgnify:CR=1 FL=1